MKRSTIAFLAVFFLGSALVVAQQSGSAQDSAYAEIVFVQGNDLMVLRGGIPIEASEPIGLHVLPGDQVQTGSHTSVELLLRPRGAMVKLSENTVLDIRDLGVAGASSLGLVYGRIRSKVTKLASVEPSFEISTSSVVAGVRGTDFGLDLVAPRAGAGSPAATTKVYCFEGSVAVSAIAPAAPSGAPPAPSPEAILISEGRMAVVESGAGQAPPTITSKPIEPEILHFWTANDFTSAVPEAPEPGELQPSARAAQAAAPGALPTYDEVASKQALSRKDMATGGGLGFVAVGAALQAAAYFVRPSSRQLSDAFTISGAAFALAGVPVLVFAISIDPLVPAKGGGTSH